MSRKGLYKEWLTKDGMTKLTGWKKNGLSDEQIANNIGIKRQTLYSWMNKYPDINDALKKGKEITVLEVENKLYELCMGKEYEEVKTVIEQDGGKKKTKVEKTKKVVQPNIIAIKYFLGNKTEKWREKSETEISGGISVKNEYEEMSEEELQKLVDEYEQINSKKDDGS